MVFDLASYEAHLNEILNQKASAGSPNMSNALALLQAYKSGPAYGYAAGKENKGVPDNSNVFKKAWKDTKGVGGRVLDVLSRGDYATMNALKTMHAEHTPDTKAGEIKAGDIGHILAGLVDPDTWKAAGRGLEGKDKTTGSDFIREFAPDAGNKTAGFGGFAFDLAGDPTSYIGPGAIKSVGKGIKGLSKLGKASKDADEALQATGAATKADQASAAPVHTGPKAIEYLPEHGPANVNPIPQPSLPLHGPFNVVPSASTEEFAHTAVKGAVAKALSKVPINRYAADTKISPLYSEVTREVPAKAPKTTAVAKSPKKAALSSDAARRNAFYQHILSNPDYRVTIAKGGRTIKVPMSVLRKDLQGAKPEVAAVIERAIKTEAYRLAKESPEYFQDTPMVHLPGREGAGRASLTVDQFAKLLETGDVPQPEAGMFRGGKVAEGADKYTSDLSNIPEYAHTPELNQFPLFDPEDLKNLHVTDMAGGRKSLQEYLKGLGVPVNKIKVTRAGGIEFPEVPKFSVGDATPITDTVKEFASLGKDKKAAWLKAHPHLNPEDVKTLQKVRISKTSVAKWDEAVANVLGGKDVGVDSMDALLEGIKQGRVDTKDLKELYKILGVRDYRGLQKAMDALERAGIQRLGPEDIKAEAANQWETPDPGDIPTAAPVKPAEEIVSDVIDKGDNTDIISMKEDLDPKQVEDLGKTLQYAVAHEILNPSDVEKYGYKSGGGTLRTDKTMHKGYGRKFDQWNEFSQYTVIKGLVARRADEIEAALKKTGVKGNTQVLRSRAMFEYVMPIMRTLDKILKEHGIPPTLLKDRPGTIASLTDVLDVMPREFAEKHFFDALKNEKGQVLNEHIPPTLWNEIGGTMVDEARGVLSPNQAIDSIMELLSTSKKLAHGKGTLRFGVEMRAKKLQGVAKQEYLYNIARSFIEHAPELAQVVERNTAEMVARGVNDAKKISTQVYNQFAKIVTQPGFTGHDLARVNSDLDNITAAVAKAAGIESPAVKSLANSDVIAQVSATSPPEVMADSAKAQEMISANRVRAAKPGRVVKAEENALSATDQSIKTMIDEGLGLSDEVSANLGKIERQLEGNLHYRFLRNFAPHLKNGDVRPIFNGLHSFYQTTSRTYSSLLNRIATQHSKEDVLAAWRELQMGSMTEHPTVGPAQQELMKAVNYLFSSDPEINVFASNGLDFNHVNSKLAKYGIPEKYALDSDLSLRENFSRWQTEEPLELLSKYNAAIMSAVNDRVLGADLTRLFSVPKGADTVRISAQGSMLGRFIDPEAHFTKEIAQQMSVLDRFMKEMAKPSSSNTLLHLYDTAIHSLKSGYTIYRPGHHIRNTVGDMYFSYLDGVNTPGPYSKSFRLMGDNKGRYMDFDANAALSAMGKAPEPANAARRILSTTVGRKSVDLTSGEVYDMAMKHGILPNYQVLEDIQFGGTRRIKVPNMPIINGRIHKLAATTSEVRDHWIRLAHFVDVLEKGKFKSLDEAARIAAGRVRKYHPDGSDLTNFESKVMRRTFLFYSWIRKAIPLVAEAMVLQPRKVTLYPKAMYAVAEANGIDPNSFGEPFPTDKLFPSWITDGVAGPSFGSDDGNYWSISPGIPSQDVLNDYARTPFGLSQTILGSSTPVFKLPAEWALAKYQGNGAVATDLRTGVPQFDRSDYIDKQIPGAGYLANITNHSPSIGFTQAVGESNDDTPQQALNAQQQSSGGLDKVALFNFFSGMGLMNQTKPSYQRQAAREQQQNNRR